jgi:hypothetical protein
VIGVGFAAELTTIARPDIGFLLYAAGQVLDGARLYVDVVEINPPLIVGLNIPPVAIARELGVSPILVYRILFALVLLACLVPTSVLLRRLLPHAVRVRRGLLLTLGFVLFPLSGQDFGQREQLLLAVTLPYILLAAVRASGIGAGRLFAIGVGTLAGVGLALKPHYLMLVVAAELYLLARTRRPATLLRPETVALLSFLAAYGAFLLLVVPEYISLVSFLGSTYSRFLYEPYWRLLVAGPGALLPLFALLSCLALRRQAGHPELWRVLAIATSAFLLGAAAQQKGLSYHFYPAFALGILMLALITLDARRGRQSFAVRLYRVVAPALLATTVVLMVVTDVRQILTSDFGRRTDVGFAQLTRFVREHASGESIFVFSYHIGSTFPLVNYAGTVSASRFPHLWMLAAAYLDELHGDAPLRYHSPAEMGPVERYLQEAVYDDLLAHHPKLLLVLRNARDDKVNGLRRLDYIAYFGRDARFRRILDGYQSLGIVGEFAAYERVPEGSRRSAPPPAATSGLLDVIQVSEPGLDRLRGSKELLLSLFVFAAALVYFARRGLPPGVQPDYPRGVDRADAG